MADIKEKFKKETKKTLDKTKEELKKVKDKTKKDIKDIDDHIEEIDINQSRR